MSDDNQIVKAGWTSVQVYAMSVLCLLVGVTVGFLFRGSTAAQGTSTTAPVMGQQQTPTGNPAGSIPAGAGQPAPEQMKQMADKQVAPLLEALKQNPKDTDTLTKVGTFYLAARQFDESAKYFEKVTTIKPSADAWTKLSNAQYYGGSGDKAIDSLNKALQIDPKFANALYNLGMLKWQVQGDVKGAIVCWEKLVKTNPNHPQIEQVKKMIARAKEHEKIPTGTKTDKPAM
jgi:cytochrome c-type biogenesis protein CcmH/NrfG